MEERGSGGVVDGGGDRVWGQKGSEDPKVLCPGDGLVAPNNDVPLPEAVKLPFMEKGSLPRPRIVGRT